MTKLRKVPGKNYGISESAIDELAQYNSEVARGIVHTFEWKTRMTVLQERYDETWKVNNA